MIIGDNKSLPLGWQWLKAKDVIDIRDGTHDSPKYQSKGVPLVTSKNLVNGEIDFSTCSLISEADHSSISKRSAVNNGDILYAMIGTIGNPVIVKKKFDFSIKNVALFKFSNDDVYNRYIYHFLKSNLVERQFYQNTRGGTQKFISLGNIRDLLIPLPAQKEQKRIAAILDKADAVRRKRQQAIDLTDQLLRSVFLDMFGDPVNNSKKEKLVKFAYVGQLDRGKSKHRPRNDPILLGGDHPLIQTGDVANSGGYITTYKTTYSEVGLKQSKKWTKGTLCITIAANIANTGVLEFDACFPDSVVGFTPNELVTVEYVQAWLGFLQKIIEDAAPESAQKNINLEILRNLNIPLPNIERQKKFSQIVHNIKIAKNKLANCEKEVTILNNSLSQRAFRGEL